MGRKITDPEEQAFVEQYVKDVQSGKFPVQCITVDACIFWRNKVLMIRRGNWPQKNFMALPGGFVEYTETLYEAVIRECKEETGIELENHWFIKNDYYDDPNRAPGIRILTHVFGFEIPHFLNFEKLPQAGDDAQEVKWVDILDILDSKPEDWFEDHYYIITDMWCRK